MTAAEIEEIRRSTQMELELFVHGALCMCVSGQCYLSSVLGARSGNRPFVPNLAACPSLQTPAAAAI